MKKKNYKIINQNKRVFIKNSIFLALLTIINNKNAFAELVLTKKDVQEPRLLGNPKAKISIIEYFSMTCSHCADFHKNTFPQIKKNLIDKGVINFEMRPFPLDGLSLRAHAICRAVPKKRYYFLVKSFLFSQENWIKSKDPVKAIKKLARKAGISDKNYNYIMSNKPFLEELINERETAAKKYSITSTPSFVINNTKTIKGAVTYTQFLKELNDFNI